MNADDHGYFHGSAQIVASRCFPLQPNARKCEQLLAELASAELIVRYESGGKRYIAINQWYERKRSRPKYPEPPSIGGQPLASADSCQQLRAVVSPHEHDQEVPRSVSTTTTNSGAPSEISLDADRGWQGITEQDRKTWLAAYPAVSVDGELAKARAWAIANPKNRKSNWRRFLSAWLSRVQDKAPVASRQSVPSERVAL